MSRTLVTLSLLCSLGLSPARAEAQTGRPLSVSFGTTSFREQPPGDVFPATDYDRGWAFLASYTRVWNRLGPAFDVGANKTTNLVGEEQELRYVLFGARCEVAHWRHATPFVTGLFGRERFTEPGFASTGDAFQIGGGIDVYAWRGFGGRATLDYQIVKYEGDDGRFRNWRIFFGGVAAIGW